MLHFGWIPGRNGSRKRQGRRGRMDQYCAVTWT